jgi:L-xylulokinase
MARWRSQQNGHARAGFYGIAGWHGRAHLLRALFEGVAFEHKCHVETLHQAGTDFDQVVPSGGGSRSTVWPQIFADVLGGHLRRLQCRCRRHDSRSALCA